MTWLEMLHGDPVPWLLEEDAAQPGVRYYALTGVLQRPADDPDVAAARHAVMATGPVPAILARQAPEGYWVKPGPGYAGKYRSTVWQVIFLAQLAADGNDARVRAGGDYVLDHARARPGGFSVDGTPSGMIHCLEGNLCAALLDLGFWGDERLEAALDWLARSVTGEGIAPADEGAAPVHYLLSGNSGPGFQCSANNRRPCAWGAVKAMLALGKVPREAWSPVMQAAIEMGITFLLSTDPATAGYPTRSDGQKPNASWFKPGYPIGYVADVLQNLEALVALGCGADERLAPALRWLLDRQDSLGRWKMEYTYNGRTWAGVERKGAPSKWVTLRALRVLAAAEKAA